MLSSILSKKECADCRFCCSFRRQSLWETPLIDSETADIIMKKYKNAVLKNAEQNSYTIDIASDYKTTDEQEEAPCPFLDSGKGCVLDDSLKPFDCKIWPLRIMNKDGELVIALTPTCPSINKQPIENVVSLVKSGLDKTIFDYARLHPDIIKDYHEGFPVISEFKGI